MLISSACPRGTILGIFGISSATSCCTWHFIKVFHLIMSYPKPAFPIFQPHPPPPPIDKPVKWMSLLWWTRRRQRLGHGSCNFRDKNCHYVSRYIYNVSRYFKNCMFIFIMLLIPLCCVGEPCLGNAVLNKVWLRGGFTHLQQVSVNPLLHLSQLTTSAEIMKKIPRIFFSRKFLYRAN
jgi:hypothetical protein